MSNFLAVRGAAEQGQYDAIELQVMRCDYIKWEWCSRSTMLILHPNQINTTTNPNQINTTTNASIRAAVSLEGDGATRLRDRWRAWSSRYSEEGGQAGATMATYRRLEAILWTNSIDVSMIMWSNTKIKRQKYQYSL